MKNILLTGGSGFIGRNILELGLGEHKIFAPTHTELDILDAKAVGDFLSTNSIEVIIHAANIGGKRKDASLPNVADTNLKMFLNLAGQMNKNQKMIFLGSGAEYNKTRDLKMVKEEDFGKSIPSDEYGFAKYSCSKYIETAENIINLRCFGVYGKYEDETQRFISSAILDALNNRPITIGQNVWFDYLYVGDLVKIIEYFVEHKVKEKFYNVGIGQPVDLLSIAKVVNQISGKDLEIKILKLGLNKEYTCNNSRLLKEIPDLKFTPLEIAVTELYNWYKSK